MEKDSNNNNLLLDQITLTKNEYSSLISFIIEKYKISKDEITSAQVKKYSREIQLKKLAEYQKIILTLQETLRAIETYSNELSKEIKYLTEIEIEVAKLKLQMRKYYDTIGMRQYWDSLKTEQKPIILTNEQLATFVKTRFYQKNGRNLILDKPYLQKIFNTLVMYFNNDPEFENISPRYKLSKGIIIFGKYGAGKSSLMSAFSVNPKQSYTVMSCEKIAQIYKGEKDEATSIVERYSNMIKVPFNTNVFKQTELALCLDDVVRETDVFKYANQTNPISYILKQRYINLPKNATHITTNFNDTEIGERYGEDVRNRLPEMFNLITFPDDALNFRLII